MTRFITGLGVLGPGFSDALQALEVLRGNQAYDGQSVRSPRVSGLAANEARRCPTTARFAIDVAQQALDGCGWGPSEVATVFSSGSGDLEVLDKNCQALARSPIALSPTWFHNSVHNAVAGYWGIAMGTRAPSTSLSAYDESFAAGLLEALMTAREGRPCLLVAYDVPPPPSLAAVRVISAPFAVGLLVSVEPAGTVYTRIDDWGWRSEPAEETGFARGAWETLRTQNPAARSLPLLQALGHGHEQRIVLSYLEGHVWLDLKRAGVGANLPNSPRLSKYDSP